MLLNSNSINRFYIRLDTVWINSSKTFFFFLIIFISTICSLKKAKLILLAEFTLKISHDEIDGEKRRPRVARSVTEIHDGKIRSVRRPFKFVRVDCTVHNTGNTTGIVHRTTSDSTEQAIDHLQRSSKYT